MVKFACSGNISQIYLNGNSFETGLIEMVFYELTINLCLFKFY